MLDGGETLENLLMEIGQTLSRLQAEPAFNPVSEWLEPSLAAGKNTLGWMLEQGRKDRDLLNSVSVPILMLFGYLCGGWLPAESALEASNLKNRNVEDDAFLDAKMATSEFYAVHLLPRTIALLDTIRGERGTVLTFDDECF